MKKLLIGLSVITFFIAMYFASLAYKVFTGGDLAWDLDKIYMNVGYCALFLSLTVYFLHLNDQKKHRNE